MANITDKIAAIRLAIFGKDVRESIASGIEAINAEVESTTERQNVIDSQEATRISNENTRKSNETARKSAESSRVTTFDNNEIYRKNSFTTSENARIATFNANEANRESLFSTNETERDAVIAKFKYWYNSSSLTGGLPFMIDGGNFGDSRTGTTYDGGNFGDPR